MSELKVFSILNEAELVKYYARKIQAFCIDHRCATCPFCTNDKCTFLRTSPDLWQGIEDAKALEKRSQGEWIKIFENQFTNGYICSCCGHQIQVTEQFLPKVTECEGCGAKMEVKINENND